MIQMRSSSVKIAAWGESRECPEIVNEVRLVVISALERNLRPVHLSLPVNGSQHVLEAAHTAEDFRGQSDLPPEQFNEPSGAQPDALADLRHSNCMRRTPELVNGICHPWMQFGRPDELLEQAALQFNKHRIDIRGGQELLTYLARSPVPQIAQID